MTSPEAQEKALRRRAEAVGLTLRKSRKHNIARPWKFIPAATSFGLDPDARRWAGRGIFLHGFATLDEAAAYLDTIATT